VNADVGGVLASIAMLASRSGTGDDVASCAGGLPASGPEGLFFALASLPWEGPGGGGETAASGPAGAVAAASEPAVTGAVPPGDVVPAGGFVPAGGAAPVVPVGDVAGGVEAPLPASTPPVESEATGPGVGVPLHANTSQGVSASKDRAGTRKRIAESLSGWGGSCHGCSRLRTQLEVARRSWREISRESESAQRGSRDPKRGLGANYPPPPPPSPPPLPALPLSAPAPPLLPAAPPLLDAVVDCGSHPYTSTPFTYAVMCVQA